jgi:hypothetical protein
MTYDVYTIYIYSENDKVLFYSHSAALTEGAARKKVIIIGK